MWGSAVGWLPIFRVADPVLCEGKADGERCVGTLVCASRQTSPALLHRR